MYEKYRAEVTQRLKMGERDGTLYDKSYQLYKEFEHKLLKLAMKLDIYN